jgi:hypothetical protein
VADLPIDLGGGLAERLARSLDVEAKIPRTLDALGPVGGRDVLLLDGVDGIRARQLAELGGRVSFATADGPAGIVAPDASADVLISLWGPYLGLTDAEAREAARVLRPGGRLLVLLDYGRDDVSRLRGDRPEYGALSRRDGPFLKGGSKVRVIHCFWTFDSLEDAGSFLDDAFGEAGRLVADGLSRPRLSYNVAIYHRTVGAADG